MKLKTILTNVGAVMMMGLFLLLTYTYGRGDCPQCGHTRTLYSCKHCSWRACLNCWQQLGEHSCPKCGRANP